MDGKPANRAASGAAVRWVAILVLWLAPMVGAAPESLSDRDARALELILPLKLQQARAFKGQMQQQERALAERDRLSQQVASGAVDLLAMLRQRFDPLSPPPDVAYHAACSVARTVGSMMLEVHWVYLPRSPVAPARIPNQGLGRLMQNASPDDPVMVRERGAQHIEAMQWGAWAKAQGFTFVDGGAGALVYERKRDQLQASMLVASMCEASPMKGLEPALVLTATWDRAAGTLSSPPDDSLEAAIEAALGRLNISPQRYDELMAAALMAHTVATRGSSFAGIPEDLMDPPMRAAREEEQAHLKWYQRQSAQLQSLLQQWASMVF